MNTLPTRSLCIATANLAVYSETFVRQHIECLPFRKNVLHGFHLTESMDAGSLLRQSRLASVARRVGRKIGSHDPDSFRVKRIVRFLTHHRVGAVLGEFGPVAARMLRPCLVADVPLIAHFHGYDAHSNEVIDANMDGYKELFRHAAAIVAVSTTMRERLVQMGAEAEKVHYIPYFVDPERFVPPARPSEDPRFLAVGRFVEKKAPHLTLLAFARVVDQVPEARLEVIGDGYLLGPCKQLAKALAIDHAVTFHGAQDHGFVADAMRRAACFVQHSVYASNGDAEGTPLAVLEAQASGLPVVATQHTGIADVVRDGETGYLVSECSTSLMGDRMADIARDPGLAHQLGANGRRRILQLFNREATIDRLSNLVRQVMK